MRMTALFDRAIDRAIGIIDPARQVRRLRARAAIAALSAYDGASRTKRALKEWRTLGNDADADLLPDLPTLRARSRDLYRNNPIATGAIKTKLTSVVGTGLQMHCRVDRSQIEMTDEAADEWENTVEREWRLFWNAITCDAARTLSGPGLTAMAYQQVLENGDVFVSLPRVKATGSVYDLRLQIIEADRVCNRDNLPETDTYSAGVKKDAFGAPVSYSVLTRHPGSAFGAGQEWIDVPALSEKTGLRNILHLYRPTRPGQTRGVPDLAPVMEPLKQLGRYTEAEIMAAVVSGMFTVFIETETGAAGFDYTNLGVETGQSSADKDYRLGNGLIMELARGEKVHDSNPGRPNANFDPFVIAILRQIGTAIEIPFELLVKHFTSSYSASRAALLTFWKYVMAERGWLTEAFLRPVYETWFFEAVAKGRIPAPGFFSDPAIRQAYLGAEFIGPSKGQIDEAGEVEAAKARVDAGFSTLQAETAQLTGGDWERNHAQQVKELKKRIADGLVGQIAPAEGNGSRGESSEEAPDAPTDDTDAPTDDTDADDTTVSAQN